MYLTSYFNPIMLAIHWHMCITSHAPTALCRLLDSMPDHSNWGLTNQGREESHDHTNTLLSLVNSKSNIGSHCQVTCKAQYAQSIGGLLCHHNAGIIGLKYEVTIEYTDGALNKKDVSRSENAVWGQDLGALLKCARPAHATPILA